MYPQQPAGTQPRRSLDVISTWALLITIIAALVVITPFITVPFAITKTFLLAAGALVTLALFILARLTRGNVVFPSSVLIGALWLPVVAYALSAAFSGTPFAGALWGTTLEPDTLGFMLVAACLGTLSALVLRRPEHYQAFFKVGAYVFGLIALLQVIVVIVGQFMPNVVSPAFSLVGSFSDLASFLGLGVVLSLVTLRLVELSERTRRALIIVSVAALFLIAIANASLVWTLIALASLGLFVEAIMRRGSSTTGMDLEEAVLFEEVPLEAEEGNHSLVLPLATLAIALFFLLGGALGGALANSLHVNISNVRPAWQSTLEVAQKTYATSAVFGSGPNTFGVEWLKHRDASLNSTVFWNTDFSSGIGFIPTSFVTTGLIGVFAWLAFIGLMLVLGLRMLMLRTPQDPFVRYIAVASFVGSIYLFSLAIFDLPSTVTLALAFVFAGLFISTTRFAANGRQLGVIFSRSPRLGFVIVFSLTILLLSSVVAAYTLVGHYIATVELSNASAEFSVGNLDKADQSAQKAITFAPYVAAYQIQTGIANSRLTIIVASSTMDKTTAQKEYQTALSTGINAALTATNIDPADYQNWIALGNLYAQAVPLGVSGAYDSAKTAYDKAQVLNPTNPQIPYILAQLDIANKDTKAAEVDLKAAIALKQDYTAAIFLLSQLEVQDGNVKGALDSALSAAYFTPDDPNILFQVGVLYAAQNDFVNAAAALSAAISANPQFANARYLLSAVYAKKNDMPQALAQMQAIAAMSSDNATAVATQLAALTAGRNPFPANLLAAPAAPVN